MKTFAETGILQSVSGTPRGVYIRWILDSDAMFGLVS